MLSSLFVRLTFKPEILCYDSLLRGGSNVRVCADKTLKCAHSNKSCWGVYFCGTMYYAVQGSFLKPFYLDKRLKYTLFKWILVMSILCCAVYDILRLLSLRFNLLCSKQNKLGIFNWIKVLKHYRPIIIYIKINCEKPATSYYKNIIKVILKSLL